MCRLIVFAVFTSGLCMTIYGWASPGIPDEKPRAAIEISQAGQQFSTARIVNTYKGSAARRDQADDDRTIASLPRI
jgi:hypothetical protein